MRQAFVLPLAAIASLSVACGGASSPSSPTVVSGVTAVIVTGTVPAVGAAAQFTATAARSDGSSQPVTSEAAWQSTNTAVATVTRGIVTAVAAGEADITATYENTTGRRHITVTTAPCTYSVSPTAVSIPAAGGTARVSVFTGAACAWTAESSEPFVTITSETSGAGNGTTSISVPANRGAARSAVLTVAGRDVSVSQGAGDCVTSVSSSNVEYSAELKRGTVTVTALTGCQWTAVSSSPFIVITPVSGFGSGSFPYRVSGNLTGAARSGSIQILNQAVTITQRAPLGGNFLSFVSDPGEFIGQGWTLLLEAPTSIFTSTAHASRSGITLTVVGSDGLTTLNWALDLAAPQGQQLVPGTYLNATKYPFQAPTVPGLNFSGTGRSCNLLSGQFTVRESVYGGDGSLQRLSVTFEQHCEGAGPALRGTVSYVR